MIASIPKGESVYNAIDYSGRKENTKTYNLVVCEGNEIHRVITVAFFKGRAGFSRVYCGLWVKTKDGRMFNGKGLADGYGYHKESEALQKAIINAGIGIDTAIGGAGETAMHDAMYAIAVASGWDTTIWKIV